MLLDDLVGVIELLKKRITDHNVSLRGNEIRTRMALIDPLLTALGWKTSDPSVVMPEFDVGGDKPDYALLGSSGTPVAFIEAKHLGVNLENHKRQLFTYAVMQQVKYAGLTDGNRWDFFDVYGSDQHILAISLTELPAHEVALKLLLLWRPNLASARPVAANEPILVVPPQPDIVPPSPPEPTPIPDPSDNWVSLSTVDAGKGNSPPTRIRFPGREPLSIKFWWQVLVEIADGLAKDGKLTAAHCPITGLGFVDSSSVTYRRYKTISGGLYVNVNWNAENIVKHSRKLLTHFNVDPSTVALYFQ